MLNSNKNIIGDNMNYRERMRNLREDNDLTQKDVGAIINKSQQGYSHIENGRAELKIDDLVLLCRFYNVSADYVIGLAAKPIPPAK
jgi:transcriptional regulator with XRE-family HTH domain